MHVVELWQLAMVAGSVQGRRAGESGLNLSVLLASDDQKVGEVPESEQTDRFL